MHISDTQHLAINTSNVYHLHLFILSHHMQPVVPCIESLHILTECKERASGHKYTGSISTRLPDHELDTFAQRKYLYLSGISRFQKSASLITGICKSICVDTSSIPLHHADILVIVQRQYEHAHVHFASYMFRPYIERLGIECYCKWVLEKSRMICWEKRERRK